MGIGAAVIGAGVLGAGASIATGSMQADAAHKASEAQTAADKSALALQQQQWQTTQQNLAPYMQAGSGAIGQYGNLIGANGAGAQTTAINALQTNPLYLAETGAGNQAILANASATGGLRSGNTNYNLGQFNANTLAQVYQQQLGNLGNLGSLGESAAAGAGNLGLGYSQLGSNTLSNIGSAQAGGILGSTAALSGGINSGLSQLLGSLSMANSLGGFGGFGGGGQAGLPQYTTGTSNIVGGPF